MPTRKTIARVGAAAIAATALLGASPAFAKDADSYINGASHAWSHGTNVQAAVADTKADSHSVYALMWRIKDSINATRLSNTRGSGTTAYSDSYANNPVLTVTACVDKQWAPDPCGSPAVTGRR
ncbi:MULTISPECIES: hypothetical protein [Streptomyces]|uniref:hypothetical protein n=1 Tax=Streptomyces TaxID=1883 RepID=UPI0004C748A0|nr:MULTISPECIES: hypothetical protein [Streptomyces]KOT57569.1 hypothetical protein ADK43_20705 [Streptomyces rimosus subsp. rimosus]